MPGTASQNVSILNESFYFPSLERHRRIWVYLPDDYHSTDNRYRVLYMQDGQNLFDEFNSFGGEWGVDETLDAEHGKVIVIGIDNGAEHRMSEYMIYDHPEHGAGEGAKYLRDLTETLKPYVDNTLRTQPERENTGIAGSSMGGLISYYAGLYFPHIFGAVGIFSPALWVNAPRIFSETKEILIRDSASRGSGRAQRWYFYAGALESETMISEVAAAVKIFREHPEVEVTYQLDAGGVHDEEVWKNYFPDFYRWLVGQKPAEVLEEQSDIKIE